MEHLEASAQLTEFMDGTLETAERRSVEEHLAGCNECQAWVEVYGRLSASLSEAGAVLSIAGHSEPASHISSEELSRFALAVETLDAAARERCSQHLETCSQCGEEVALVGAAAAEAREGRELEPLVAQTSKTWFPRLAWAAGLLLVAGVVFFGRAEPEAPASHRLTDAMVSDLTTLGSPDSILVEATRIESGAELNLRAGNSVAFGDGFSVDSGGTLSVVLDQSHDS